MEILKPSELTKNLFLDLEMEICACGNKKKCCKKYLKKGRHCKKCPKL